jgi:hypothetical protein
MCLREPIAGWQVTEANPLADWLFESLGLVPGLLVDTAITLVAVAFLLTTRFLPRDAKRLFFGFVVAWTAYAVVNNLHAISELGISPLG